MTKRPTRSLRAMCTRGDIYSRQRGASERCHARGRDGHASGSHVSAGAERHAADRSQSASFNVMAVVLAGRRDSAPRTPECRRCAIERRGLFDLLNRPFQSRRAGNAIVSNSSPRFQYSHTTYHPSERTAATLKARDRFSIVISLAQTVGRLLADQTGASLSISLVFWNEYRSRRLS